MAPTLDLRKEEMMFWLYLLIPFVVLCGAATAGVCCFDLPHIVKALPLFEKGLLALVAEEGFEPSTSGLRAAPRVSLRHELSLAIALISVDLRHKAILSLLRLARPGLSR